MFQWELSEENAPHAEGAPREVKNDFHLCTRCLRLLYFFLNVGATFAPFAHLNATDTLGARTWNNRERVSIQSIVLRSFEMVKLVAGSNWANAKSTMKGSTIKKVALKAKSKKEIIELERSKKRKKRSEDKQLKRMTPILDTNRIVAMDCEMVGVGANGERSVLARCSIVDYDGNVLYDQIVQPLEKVTDFRTKYSGIRSKTLRKAISFREVFCLLWRFLLAENSVSDKWTRSRKEKF